MLNWILSLGVVTKEAILAFAGTLAGDAVPGVVVLVLAALALVAAVWAILVFSERVKAVKKLRKELASVKDRPLSEGREVISAGFAGGSPVGKMLEEAWSEFNETLFLDDANGTSVLRNSVRPAVFFNLDDLHFGPGFFRILPGVFVSVGLALTFLGLIAALNTMGLQTVDDQTMASLISIAAAKFIMSLTGLVCSIALTILLRILAGRLDAELNGLCRDLERRMTFASLEEISMRQLAAMVEDREHHRQLTLQMIAEIGGPLRTELPEAISGSITAAMQPLLDKVGRQGSESMSTIATDLSQQLTSGIGQALGQASDKLALAGDKISQLSDRMDSSSGRMGAEMEAAVARMAQAIDDLRGAMTATAESTASVFGEGAEQLLAAMNRTLEGIRENTSDGAKAMSNAAEEMRKSAEAMRTEMEGAAQAGAEAARVKMEAAGQEASGAIGAAGQSVIVAFDKAGSEISRQAEALSAKAGTELLGPIDDMVKHLDKMVAALDESAIGMRRMVDGVRDGAAAGAEAATSFRSASKDLVAAAEPVRATTERIEGALRQMADGTREAVTTVTQSARMTAENASNVLATAKQTLAAERRGIDASLAAVEEMLRRLQGQGDRMDDIDQKLGKAFDLYATQTEQAMQSVRSHVEDMSKGLNGALALLQSILDGLQEFQPQQGRR